MFFTRGPTRERQIDIGENGSFDGTADVAILASHVTDRTPELALRVALSVIILHCSIRVENMLNIVL